MNQPTPGNADTRGAGASNEQLVASADKLKASGKEVGQVHAPIVSVNPISTEPNKDGWTQKPEKKFLKIANAADGLFEAGHETDYPFSELEAGEGMFIAPDYGKTVDDLVEDTRKQVHRLKQQFIEFERNEDGDELLDHVTEKTRKRNEDGTLQLQHGVPITGANYVQLPRATYLRNYAVRSVTNGSKIGDQEAPADGVLVVRLY